MHMLSSHELSICAALYVAIRLEWIIEVKQSYHDKLLFGFFMEENYHN